MKNMVNYIALKLAVTLIICAGIKRTVSQAWRIGRAIALCRKKNTVKGIPQAILTLQNGACLFVGKIMNVTRVRIFDDTQNRY